MTLKNIKHQFVETLKKLYEPEEIELFFYRCLEQLEQKTKMDFVLNPLAEAREDTGVLWQRYLRDLERERPLQYVLEQAYFYDLTFFVTEGVLIPRPETEELVEWILQTVPADRPLRILDVGTGSGCIAITLAKKLPLAHVTAIDVSEMALEVGAKNAVLNGVEVEWVLQNILDTAALSDCFDVIVSNPPYVRDLEKVEIHNNVKVYEPALALFVPDHNPLLFYRKIAELAAAALLPSGWLFFEINQYLGAETLQLIDAERFEEPELKRDFRDNERMLRAQRKALL
ncbi:peptide chain release factor N(5)-glutamine methyltransferase [Flavobacterium sp. JP2137]|uniref:peptide chain release factor N(5)-glutamine methyltransferase n=1 Tax=Flavobacterium sp. JP2137 TaxID=3414510 RepID=UPI003D300826